MKILLASSGISNISIHDALVGLLGKPIAESSALCIPTGVQPFPGGPGHVYRFISGATMSPMCGLGWKSLGLLELTALPSIRDEYWVPAVQEADALLVWGGSPLYLCYWMRQSGPRWSTAPWKSCPKGAGCCSRLNVPPKSKEEVGINGHCQSFAGARGMGARGAAPV
jgi:hypothetical protein